MKKYFDEAGYNFVITVDLTNPIRMRHLNAEPTYNVTCNCVDGWNYYKTGTCDKSDMQQVVTDMERQARIDAKERNEQLNKNSTKKEEEILAGLGFQRESDVVKDKKEFTPPKQWTLQDYENEMLTSYGR
jgi:hypothetical protein